MPPEVIKAAVNKIAEQASGKAGMKLFCFLLAKQCFFQLGILDLLVDMMLLHYSRLPSWIGVRSSKCAFTIIFQYKCAFSLMRAAKNFL